MRPLQTLWYRVNYTDALVDRRRKVLLDWSAKAGCTVAIKMFFRYLGLLEEAERHSDWVHRYRTHVYYRTHGLATYRDLLDPDIVKIKVVRNPYQRAVSSYIHTMKHQLPEMRSVAGKTTFDLTFREFLQTLCRLDLSCCNPHYRTQARPYEDQGVVFDRIVHLETLSEDLAKTAGENAIALDPTGLTSLHHIQKSSHAMPGAADTQWAVVSKQVPAYESFYDAATERLVEQLYGPDFRHYGYAFGFRSEGIPAVPPGGVKIDKQRRPWSRGLKYRVFDFLRYTVRPLRK